MNNQSHPYMLISLYRLELRMPPFVWLLTIYQPKYQYYPQSSDYIYGRIGDGTIGIDAIEDFTNGKTDVKAYIDNKAITYYHKEKYYHKDCFCRRRNLRGLLRALCGHWHTKQKPIKNSSKFKSILKYY